LGWLQIGLLPASARAVALVSGIILGRTGGSVQSSRTMHTLEFCLFALSERIRHETGNEKLADTASQLAGESHQYVPEREEYEERLSKSKLAKDLHRWFDGQQKSKLKRRVR
jgi:hypothetical protein